MFDPLYCVQGTFGYLMVDHEMSNVLPPEQEALRFQLIEALFSNFVLLDHRLGTHPALEATVVFDYGKQSITSITNALATKQGSFRHPEYPREDLMYIPNDPASLMAPLPNTQGVGGVLAVQRTGGTLSRKEHLGMVQCLAAMMSYCRIHHSQLPSQPDTIVQGLGKTMRAVRREFGLSLNQVAERMACKPQHVSGWERVTLKLPIPELFKWAESLGLFAWQDKPIIQVRTLNQAVLKMVKKNPEQMKLLTPEQFELLVAERLDKAGYRVEMTGDVNQKDGGVDLIAVPKAGMVPYMIAVQAKHHHTDRKTGRPAVDRLLSWRERFDVGLLVTNTSFTADACFAAMHGNQERAPFVRLRDFNDLKRWLMNDFSSTHDWREIPTSVELAPGVTIEVPRPILSEVSEIWPFKNKDLKGFK